MTENLPLSGADALVGTLKAAGVRCIFSLSGNQIMPVYDALLESGIRLIHVRHEASAVYMAEAWAQLTGQTGVALVTAGAGFGNALGALLSCRASETPVLLLSGDSPRAQDGKGAFQELDQVAMASPVAKFAYRAQSADTLSADVDHLLAQAKAGRPGPVLLALPADVLTAPVVARPNATTKTPPIADLTQADGAAIAAFLDAGQRPLILTGPLLSRTRSGDATLLLRDALSVPVLCMESPRGLRDPSLGAIVEVTRQADRILLLGKSPDFTTGFLGKDIGAPEATFAIIDPERYEIDRASTCVGDRLVLTARADVRPALNVLISAASELQPGPNDRTAWLAEVAAATSRRIGSVDRSRGAHALHPATISAAIAARLAETPGAVLICDGGECGQWAQSIIHDGPRIINGVSGAIGAGPAYAIAASLACPDVPVFAMMGDGTAGFLLAEYETAAREKAGFVAVIGNDDRWNAEYQIQINSFGADRAHSCTLSSATRYDLAAAALGAHGSFVDKGDAAALDEALQQAQATGRPACVNVRMQAAPAPVIPSQTLSPVTVH